MASKHAIAEDSQGSGGGSAAGRGRKRERSEQEGGSSGEASKALSERFAPLPDDAAALGSSELGLTGPDAVGGLVDLMREMQSDGSKTFSELAWRRGALVSLLAATEEQSILEKFLQKGGLRLLDEWLQEAHKRKGGNGGEGSGGATDCDSSLVEDLLCMLLRALDRLPVGLEALKSCCIGKSVNQLRSHRNLEIQKKSRRLVEIWKKRVDETLAEEKGGEKVIESSGSSVPSTEGGIVVRAGMGQALSQKQGAGVNGSKAADIGTMPEGSLPGGRPLATPATGMTVSPSTSKSRNGAMQEEDAGKVEGKSAAGEQKSNELNKAVLGNHGDVSGKVVECRSSNADANVGQSNDIRGGDSPSISVAGPVSGAGEAAIVKQGGEEAPEEGECSLTDKITSTVSGVGESDSAIIVKGSGSEREGAGDKGQGLKVSEHVKLRRQGVGLLPPAPKEGAIAKARELITEVQHARELTTEGHPSGRGDGDDSVSHPEERHEEKEEELPKENVQPKTISLAKLGNGSGNTENVREGSSGSAGPKGGSVQSQGTKSNKDGVARATQVAGPTGRELRGVAASVKSSAGGKEGSLDGPLGTSEKAGGEAQQGGESSSVPIGRLVVRIPLGGRSPLRSQSTGEADKGRHPEGCKDVRGSPGRIGRPVTASRGDDWEGGRGKTKDILAVIAATGCTQGPGIDGGRLLERRLSDTLKGSLSGLKGEDGGRGSQEDTNKTGPVKGARSGLGEDVVGLPAKGRRGERGGSRVVPSTKPGTEGGKNQAMSSSADERKPPGSGQSEGGEQMTRAAEDLMSLLVEAAEVQGSVPVREEKADIAVAGEGSNDIAAGGEVLEASSREGLKEKSPLLDEEEGKHLGGEDKSRVAVAAGQWFNKGLSETQIPEERMEEAAGAQPRRVAPLDDVPFAPSTKEKHEEDVDEAKVSGDVKNDVDFKSIEPVDLKVERPGSSAGKIHESLEDQGVTPAAEKDAKGIKVEVRDLLGSLGREGEEKHSRTGRRADVKIGKEEGVKFGKNFLSLGERRAGKWNSSSEERKETTGADDGRRLSLGSTEDVMEMAIRVGKEAEKEAGGETPSSPDVELGAPEQGLEGKLQERLLLGLALASSGGGGSAGVNRSSQTTVCIGGPAPRDAYTFQVDSRESGEVESECEDEKDAENEVLQVPGEFRKNQEVPKARAGKENESEDGESPTFVEAQGSKSTRMQTAKSAATTEENSRLPNGKSSPLGLGESSIADEVNRPVEQNEKKSISVENSGEADQALHAEGNGIDGKRQGVAKGPGGGIPKPPSSLSDSEKLKGEFRKGAESEQKKDAGKQKEKKGGSSVVEKGGPLMALGTSSAEERMNGRAIGAAIGLETAKPTHQISVIGGPETDIDTSATSAPHSRKYKSRKQDGPGTGLPSRPRKNKRSKTGSKIEGEGELVADATGAVEGDVRVQTQREFDPTAESQVKDSNMALEAVNRGSRGPDLPNMNAEPDEPSKAGSLAGKLFSNDFSVTVKQVAREAAESATAAAAAALVSKKPGEGSEEDRNASLIQPTRSGGQANSGRQISGSKEGAHWVGGPEGDISTLAGHKVKESGHAKFIGLDVKSAVGEMPSLPEVEREAGGGSVSGGDAAISTGGDSIGSRGRGLKSADKGLEISGAVRPRKRKAGKQHKRADDPLTPEHKSDGQHGHSGGAGEHGVRHEKERVSFDLNLGIAEDMTASTVALGQSDNISERNFFGSPEVGYSVGGLGRVFGSSGSNGRKIESGWRGPALTSAFRTPEPLENSTLIGGGAERGGGNLGGQELRASRPALDIDLNFTDVRALEDAGMTLNSLHGPASNLHGGMMHSTYDLTESLAGGMFHRDHSASESSRLDLDLNRMDPNEDAASPRGLGLKGISSMGTTRPPLRGVSSEPMQPPPRLSPSLVGGAYGGWSGGVGSTFSGSGVQIGASPGQNSPSRRGAFPGNNRSSFGKVMRDFDLNDGPTLDDASAPSNLGGSRPTLDLQSSLSQGLVSRLANHGQARPSGQGNSGKEAGGMGLVMNSPQAQAKAVGGALGTNLNANLGSIQGLGVAGGSVPGGGGGLAAPLWLSPSVSAAYGQSSSAFSAAAQAAANTYFAATGGNYPALNADVYRAAAAVAASASAGNFTSHPTNSMPPLASHLPSGYPLPSALSTALASSSFPFASATGFSSQSAAAATFFGNSFPGSYPALASPLSYNSAPHQGPLGATLGGAPTSGPGHYASGGGPFPAGGSSFPASPDLSAMMAMAAAAPASLTNGLGGGGGGSGSNLGIGSRATTPAGLGALTVGGGGSSSSAGGRPELDLNAGPEGPRESHAGRELQEGMAPRDERRVMGVQGLGNSLGGLFGGPVGGPQAAAVLGGALGSGGMMGVPRNLDLGHGGAGGGGSPGGTAWLVEHMRAYKQVSTAGAKRKEAEGGAEIFQGALKHHQPGAGAGTGWR